MPIDYQRGPQRPARTQSWREKEAESYNMLQTLAHRQRFSKEFHLTGAGVSFPGFLVVPPGNILKPNLRLINMSGIYLSGSPTGNTTVVLNNLTPLATLATFTLTQALATSTQVSTDYDVEITPGMTLALAVGTDNGHRGIILSAWFSQVPAR